MTPSPRVLATVILLAAWLGAALLVTAVVAPAAFAVLPSRTLAGTMVGRVLPAVFASGMAVGIVAIVVAALDKASLLALATATLSTASCAVAQFVINPRIAALRLAIAGPVEALPQQDPRRVAFGALHGYSVGGLGVAMLSAGTCLVILVLALRPRS